MKRILMNVLGLVLIAGALTTTSCKKGDEGPAGPKGDSAIANVYYSAWVQLTDDKWQQPTGANYLVAEIAAPKVTADILAKGSIHVYLNYNTAAEPYVLGLPFIGATTATPTVPSVPLYVRSVADLGYITVITNAGIGLPDGTTGGFYRYILIPGGVKLAARTAGKSIDWNNYSEVKTYLGLKD
jgi:hypothetical protein